jgi:hypothetical protein
MDVAESLVFILDHVPADIAEMAPPRKDTGVREQVPKFPYGLASTRAGHESSGNPRERAKEGLKFRSLLGLEEKMQVIS